MTKSTMRIIANKKTNLTNHEFIFMFSIKFKITTPEKTVYEDEIYQATLPVADGEVTILPNHRSYIASLKSGEIILKKKGEEKEIDLAISGGFIEFHSNELIVLADTAERAEEIDLKRAEEVIVTGVEQFSSAYDANIHVNDVILEINDEKIYSLYMFEKRMSKTEKGKVYILKMKRRGNVFHRFVEKF